MKDKTLRQLTSPLYGTSRTLSPEEAKMRLRTRRRAKKRHQRGTLRVKGRH